MKLVSNQQVEEHLKRLNPWWEGGRMDPVTQDLRPRAYLRPVKALLLDATISIVPASFVVASTLRAQQKRDKKIQHDSYLHPRAASDADRGGRASVQLCRVDGGQWRWRA
jgi:hypothetical protein